MSQGLHLSQKMALQQVLAPQLQQSLALLQAPTMELKALVEQELEQNPVLEEAPSTETEPDESASQEVDTSGIDPAEPPSDVNYDSRTEGSNGEPVDEIQAEINRLTQLDQEWREHFSQTNVPNQYSQEDEERRQFMFESIADQSSLQENLLEQLRLTELPDEDRQVTETIIGNIDDHGYLQASVEELAVSTNTAAEKVSEMLGLVQSFYPAGVGARNLRECLMLQMERNEQQNELEYRIVRDHMEALGKRRFPEIARQLNVTVQEVQEAAERIAYLDPRPGREFTPEVNQYIYPEVFVQKVDDDYVVTSNKENQPHLRISNAYKDLMAKAETSAEVREYIRDKIRAGKTLIKSLHQREDTILSIAREIVKQQREFLEHGVSHLKPMTMMQVAEAVGVHETTVSRAVSGKYMQTPQGLFEMKFFFSSGIQTDAGQGISNTSVKDMIADMIRKEDPHNPLSDEKIVELLKEKGIKLARRTVAKYRSELNILVSHLRKVY